MADTGGLQWFQLKPPLKERAPLIRDDRYREEQKSPWSMDTVLVLGAVIRGKFFFFWISYSKKGVKTFFFFFFLVFTSSLAGVFVKLKPPLKISRSATAYREYCWFLRGHNKIRLPYNKLLIQYYWLVWECKCSLRLRKEEDYNLQPLGEWHT